MNTPHASILLLSAALAVGGCSSDPSGSGGEEACNGCHGADSSGAPSDAAHTLHLAGGELARPVACSECHPLPASGSQHRDGTVQVGFGAFAKTGGRSPTWNGSSCSSVYCHGTSSPVWTEVDTTPSCTTCHGHPPAGDHPQVALSYCSGCHAATVTAAGALVAGGTQHLDGTEDATAFSHPGSWLAGHQPAALADAAAGCMPCHGADLKGGTSGKSCWSCHPTGPPL